MYGISICTCLSSFSEFRFTRNNTALLKPVRQRIILRPSETRTLVKDKKFWTDQEIFLCCNSRLHLRWWNWKHTELFLVFFIIYSLALGNKNDHTCRTWKISQKSDSDLGILNRETYNVENFLQKLISATRQKMKIFLNGKKDFGKKIASTKVINWLISLRKKIETSFFCCFLEGMRPLQKSFWKIKSRRITLTTGQILNQKMLWNVWFGTWKTKTCQVREKKVFWSCII